MSLTYAHVAVPGKRDEFRDAFLDIWDNFRLIEESGELAGYEKLMAWSSPRCEYLRGQPAHDVKAFGQDGKWAVLADLSLLLAEDGDRLRRLSARFGTAAVGRTQGVAGAALFSLYEQGALRRELADTGRGVATVGEPVPAEEGVNVGERFSLDQIERVWRALGLRSVLGMPPAPFVAVHLLDTTARARPDVRRKRPWWKWW